MKSLNPKTVLVTRTTRLFGLRRKFNTVRQAKFWVEHMGQSFDDYEREDDTYSQAVKSLKTQLAELGRPVHAIDRVDLPTYYFTENDVIVTVGQDGLVVNVAKYLSGQPIVAVNPDPARIDGILLPFHVKNAMSGVSRAIAGNARTHAITMAEAKLNDGQTLLAFNDFLVGQKSHVSARYRISWGGQTEEQSSSGVLISTGAGSTGWLSSMQHMAKAVAQFVGRQPVDLPTLRLNWDDPRLAFVVREPFASKVTGVQLAAGLIQPGEPFRIESKMSEGGVIFSDGFEQDALAFNAGNVVTIQASNRKTRLVMPD
jgi:NAD kinase